MLHEGDGVGDTELNVAADMRAVLAAAATAGTAAAPLSDPMGGAGSGVALQAWLAAATTATQRLSAADPGRAAYDVASSPLSPPAAVVAQDTALQAAMVAHAAAGGTVSPADAAAEEARAAEDEARRAEALLAAVAASARRASLRGHLTAGDETS